MRKTVLIPRVRVSAWHGNTNKRAPMHKVTSVEEALHGRYEGEACFVGYAPAEGTKLFPRLSKAALTYFETQPPEKRPTLEVVPVDIDYGNHEVPPDEWHTGVVEKVPFASFGWYRTPHGLRLVFLPQEPVPLRLADAYINWIHERLAQVGIETDVGTTDWTRLFKLPHALGLKLPKDLSGLAPLDVHPEDLQPSDLTKMGDIVHRDRPTEELKLTKSQMNGLPTQLKELLYHGNLAADVGDRHRTLLATALQVTSVLETNDPLIPYEMLLPSSDKMGKGRAELWRVCEWAAAAYSGGQEMEEETRLSLREMAAEAMGCPPSQVAQRLVIDTGKEFFVWDEETMSYSHAYTNESRQLLAACDRHCPQLMAWPEKTDDVWRNYSSVAEKVVYVYEPHPKDEGVSRIRRGFHADTNTLFMPICAPDPALEPRFNADIHVWLKAMFEGEHYENAMDWLASVPRITEPLCALYIKGDPGIGKGLLTAGLARLWNRQKTITKYKELVGEFNPTLKNSPIVVADEKVPTDAFKRADSATFRQHLGGDNVTIRDLYRSPATLVGCPRIMITANNESALQIQEDLNQHDIDAIRERIGFIEAGAKAREVLVNMANKKGISVPEMCQPWLDGGGIAEHILYLCEEREVERGRRFLVQGWDSVLTRNLPSTVGVAPAIVEAIALAIYEDRHNDAVRWFGGNIYVNNPLLGAEWADLYGHERERMPKSTSRLEAIKGMSTGKHRMRAQHGDSHRWYWVVDPAVVAQAAVRANICTKEELMKAISRVSEEEKVIFDLTSAEETLDSKSNKNKEMK